MRSGHNNEVQLTDSLNELIETPGLFGLEFDGERFDCGNKLGFIEANLKFGLNDKDIKTELKKLLEEYENYYNWNWLCWSGIWDVFCRVWSKVVV